MLRAAMCRSAARAPAARTSMRRGVDWGRLSARMTSDEAKVEYAKFRAAITQMEQDIAAAPAEDPKIDWAGWKARIRTPGVVDDVQRRWESAPWPTVSLSPESIKMMDDSLSELTNLAVSLDSTADAKIGQLERILEMAQVERDNLPFLTADDILRKHPQWKEDISEQIKQDKWDWV